MTRETRVPHIYMTSNTFLSLFIISTHTHTVSEFVGTKKMKEFSFIFTH